MVLRPVASSTRASSPVAVSTTYRLPLPSRLAAAGVLKSRLMTVTAPLAGSIFATEFLNHSGPYSMPSGPTSKPLKPPRSLAISRGAFAPAGSSSHNASPRNTCDAYSLPLRRSKSSEFRPGRSLATMRIGALSLSRMRTMPIR